MQRNEFLKYLGKLFDLPLVEMKKLIKDFHSEMLAGLSDRKSSLEMIPAYADRPKGGERGKFLGIDLGGTNFRIMELELKGDGRAITRKIKNFILDDKLLAGTRDEFFGFLARSIKTFIYEKKITVGERVSLGFTFSFPVRQSGIADGELLRWTKGFRVKGVIGKDVVGLLDEALRKEGMCNMTVTAIANDTVSTLIAKSYEDKNCDVGVILGTGTNACYAEFLSEIKKWRGPIVRRGRMIVNIEWGNFNKLRRTPYDKTLDSLSDNHGSQIFEKMVSGMYLGEVARLVFEDLISKGMLFEGRPRAVLARRGMFKTEHISRIETDISSGLSKVENTLKDLGIKKSTLADRRLVKRVCAFVSRRAGRIVAASIASVVTKSDPGLSKEHTIAIDGSVYERNISISKNIRRALKELFKNKASRIRLSLTKDGSARGAAILASLGNHFA